MKTCWTFFVIFLTVVSETSGILCTERQVSTCMEYTMKLRKELGISDQLKHFPIYLLNDTYLDEYCKVASQTTNCLHIMYNCPSELKLLTGGLVKATKYLCEETLSEYITYQDCHKQVVVQLKLERCEKKYERRFEVARYKDDLCRTVDEWYNCIRQAAKPGCTDAAAEWQVNYMKKLVEPVMDKINCGGTGLSNSGISNSGISNSWLSIRGLSKTVGRIIISLFVFVVIVLVTIVYRYCKRENASGVPSPVLTFSKDGNV